MCNSGLTWPNRNFNRPPSKPVFFYHRHLQTDCWMLGAAPFVTPSCVSVSAESRAVIGCHRPGLRFRTFRLVFDFSELPTCLGTPTYCLQNLDGNFVCFLGWRRKTLRARKRNRRKGWGWGGGWGAVIHPEARAASKMGCLPPRRAHQ